MAEAVREVQYAIASLPLPWGAAELNAPLARVSDALAVLRDTAAAARPSDTRRVVVTEAMFEAATHAYEQSLAADFDAGNVIRDRGKYLRAAIDAAINAGAGQ
jgi:hypothetical protein